MGVIDDFLDRIAPYRLARNGLGILAAISIAFAFFGFLPYTAMQLTASLILILATAILTNKVYALYSKAKVAPESAWITALVLFFVLMPLQDAHTGFELTLITIIAVLSKYLIAPLKKHIFNPAAFTLAFVSLWGKSYLAWWVVSPLLLPFVAVIGLLFVRKLRRFDMVLTFLIMAATIAVWQALPFGSPVHALSQLVFAGPLVFFATVMLTDPQTSPSMRPHRIVYGAIVGFLYSFPFSAGIITASPPLALLIGNLYAYVTNTHKRVVLEFHAAIPLTRDIYEFAFLPRGNVRYQPGQHMEWLVPHKSPDKRGNRRVFAFASAPNDPFVRIATRIPVDSSSFKKALQKLSKNVVVQGGLVGGRTPLPKDAEAPVGIIAHDLGIAPFMSTFRHMAEKNEYRDMVLVYTVRSPLDLAYRDEIEAIAERIGLTVLYLPSDYAELSGWTGKYGFLSQQLLRRIAPDFLDRNWQVSGPWEVVQMHKKLLISMGVPSSSIQIQEFSGL